MLLNLRFAIVCAAPTLAFALATGCASAAELLVGVVDAEGRPVEYIAIVATPTSDAPANRIAPTTLMDQLNKQFVPELLVVRTGTAVLFPNSDKVAHQVYSFSQAKRFSLPLYRGKEHPPVVFDKAGIVTLGCNIHDNMVGYVLVTDSPYFGKTDRQGQWRMDVPSGSFKVSVWHPRLNETIADQTATLDGARSITFKLTRPLKPAPRASDERTRDY